MVRLRSKKCAKKTSRGFLKLNFELECACCSKRYQQHTSNVRGSEFFPRGESAEKALNINALLGSKSECRRRRKSWTASHSDLLRILLEVFGEKHLIISPAVFDVKEEFIRKKASELAAAQSRSVSPAPVRASPALREVLKQTPNLSTADKLGRITPHFTPKPGAMDMLRFTPESYYFRRATPSMVYNPLSTYAACKFPDITCEHLWEQPMAQPKMENKWEFCPLPTPGGKLSMPVSPMMFSSRATPLVGFSPLTRLAKPVIERI